MSAATNWQRFDITTADLIMMPRPGEWMLWSIVTNKGREYYSGAMLDIWTLSLDGYPLRTVSIDERTYWARVMKILPPRCLECDQPLTKDDPPETDKCKSCYEDYER